MKLLLVDDEKYTREGICSMLPWKEMGITHVEEADDGINALQKALEIKPDIILTDVRMPRMDGIKMAYKIREIVPHCSIIFISGYSDKEYLKSAIKLSAIDYIEKPIDLKELRATIENAVSMLQEEEEKRRYKTELRKKLNSSIPVLKNYLALGLAEERESYGYLWEYMDIAAPGVNKDAEFITVLIKILIDKNVSEYQLKELLQQKVLKLIEKRLSEEGFEVIMGIKDESLVIAHIQVNPAIKHKVNDDLTASLCSELNSMFSRPIKILISAGNAVKGISNICKSYNKALAGLQNELLIYKLAEYLKNNDKNGCISLIKKIVQGMSSDTCKTNNTPGKHAVDYYSRLMHELMRVSEEKNIAVFNRNEKGNLDRIISNFLYSNEIEKYLLMKVELYFNSMFYRNRKNTIAESIRKNIDDNISNPQLSLITIAKHLNMSIPYMCVVFKDEQKKTINQYITECRIEKAKEYLLNSNMKIKDIAANVGFTDCNYFIKVFRRMTGLTPMEFRELKSS